MNDRTLDLRGRSRGGDRGSSPTLVQQAGACLLEILIVEDDADLAVTLKDMIELEPDFRVTATASDLAGALTAIAAHRPGLALIDIHLGGYGTGIEVAAHTQEAGIPTLFSTGNPLPFPVPELALGCLCKPYNCYSVCQSLRVVDKIIRGDPVDQDIPPDLELY